jgi:hypothetical protein
MPILVSGWLGFPIHGLLRVRLVHSTNVDMTEEIKVHAPADFHVHLRQGKMASLVVPLVRQGGFKLAYVMVPHFLSDHCLIVTVGFHQVA